MRQLPPVARCPCLGPAPALFRSLLLSPPLCLLLSILLCMCRPAGLAAAIEDPPQLSIGSRLEPLVDGFLIEQLEGDAEQRMHVPTPREVVLVTGEPWEGNTSMYFTIFQDDDRFRMYYRGSHYDTSTRKATHPEYTCYAESRDGIHWTKPELGLFEFEGSKSNNIVWQGIGTHCFAPFKDSHPQCAPEARYKALSRGRPQAPAGLYAFHSEDGIHWSLTQDAAVITTGAFDSQNLAFWDAERNQYRAYHRHFRDRRRDIMMETSDDFIHWSEPQFLDYPDAAPEHLYTNAVMPYPHAPHVFVGFPTRYEPGSSQVEPILMTSRDGRTFQRWSEPLIPITAPLERDGNRSNYMARGLVELPGQDGEYSMYASEAYYAGPDMRLRRFSIRRDGFVSIHADQEGTLLTRPLRFAGDHLVINYAAGEGGYVRVEVQDASGRPLDGFQATACRPLNGDDVAAIVSWQGVKSLSDIGANAIRLKFEMKNSDIYAIRFAEAERVK